MGKPFRLFVLEGFFVITQRALRWALGQPTPKANSITITHSEASLVVVQRVIKQMIAAESRLVLLALVFALAVYGLPAKAIAWQVETTGTADPSTAEAVTVDAVGDVIAVGKIRNQATDDDFAVIKLSGLTGTELWRLELDGTARVQLTREELGRCDCAAIITGHSGVDYELVLEEIPVIVDTRNALKGHRSPKIFRL